MDNRAKVIRFNRLYPPGTIVFLLNDGAVVELTETRSEAWLLGSGVAVVKVKGRAGGYLLDRIKPLPTVRNNK